MRRVTRSTSASEVGVELRRRPRPRGRARVASRSSAGGAGAATGRGSRLCASACRWRPAARPSIATRPLGAARDLADGRDAARRAASRAVTGPTPHSRSTASGWRNSSSRPAAREQPVGLRDAARDLREELRACDADGDRQADLARARSRRSVRAISSGVPDAALHPAHVEERLVDREPLDERRGVVEHAEHRLARLAVRREPRRHDDRLRAQLPRPPLPIAVRMPNAFAS